MLEGLTREITEFLRESPLNRVEGSDIFIYDGPLLGVASARDSLFAALKEPQIVGPQHLLPEDWLPDAQSVISYFLPYSAGVRSSNREAGLPSKEWLHARWEGEILNDAVRRFAVDYFHRAGIEAVSPVLDKQFASVGYKSNWSERHIAHIAGLGTFCLNRSLISRKGSAGRYGSVIVNTALTPSRRDYETYDAYCTQCGACIARCPVEAISGQGKDNAACKAYLDSVRARFAPRYGCGKCQTGVPCENEIPAL